MIRKLRNLGLISGYTCSSEATPVQCRSGMLGLGYTQQTLLEWSAGNGKRENENWEQNREWLIKLLWVLGFKLVVVSIFPFPVPDFSNIPGNLVPRVLRVGERTWQRGCIPGRPSLMYTLTRDF